eukprot:1172053-Pyramimonas_sp.AAC.1
MNLRTSEPPKLNLVAALCRTRSACMRGMPSPGATSLRCSLRQAATGKSWSRRSAPPSLPTPLASTSLTHIALPPTVPSVTLAPTEPSVTLPLTEPSVTLPPTVPSVTLAPYCAECYASPLPSR